MHARMPEVDGVVRVLSFAIRGPRRWNDHERATLRSVADLLDHGFDDARVKAELQASEQRFRTVFEQSPFGMGVLDTEGCFSEVNSVLCRILEYDGSELVRRTLEELTHPAGRETLRDVPTHVRKGQMGQVQ